MKEYLSTTKGNYRHTPIKKFRSWLVGTVVIVILGLLFPWFFSKVSALVLYPVHVLTKWVKTSDSAIPYHLRSRGALISEIESLKQQIVTETGTQLSIKRLMDENAQLRSLFPGEKTNSQPIVSQVLARPTALRYDLLQIDKGARHGVVVGAPVFFSADSVLGVVTYVEDDYAFVDMFTSPNFVTTAYVVGPNVFAVMEGLGGGSARLRLPQGVALKEGQLVILPGINGGVYGEIVRVEDDPKQPEQYGYVVPTLSISNLRYVLVGQGVVTPKTDVEIDVFATEAVRKLFFVSSSTMYQVSDPFTVVSTTSASNSDR